MLVFPLLLSVTSLNPFLGLICCCTRSMYAAPWPMNIPLVSYYKSVKSWCRSWSLAVLNMIVCEVEQPSGESCKSCISYSGWKKSCNRD
jgi:hypothetical protein